MTRLTAAPARDAMFCGTGDDIYIVAAAGDVTTVKAGYGTDTVRSCINWTPGANIKRLELLGSAADGTGNLLNNTLVGNSLSNVLNGGAGNGYMVGGGGDDIFVVAATGDSTIENAGGGNDTVRSYTNWTLAANVERLELRGSGNLNETGNSLNNRLVGNLGNNCLSDGDGNDYITAGAGNDRLIGGAGCDILNGGTGNFSDAGVNGDSTADMQILVGGTNFTTARSLCASPPYDLPYWSSNRTISSSPRYDPVCTSINSSRILPGFSSA